MTQQATRPEHVEPPLTMTVSLTRTPDGTLRIAGTRIPIDRIIHAYLRGQTAEQFCQDFPSVSVADVHAVIAYYLQNRAVVDQYLRGREERADLLRREIERDTPLHDLRERLLRRREELQGASDALR